MTDRLLRNLFIDCQSQDARHGFRQQGQFGPKVRNLVAALRFCGVGFTAWFKRNKNDQVTSKIEFTSLNGNERKKVLHNMLNKLEVILGDHGRHVVKLWKDFTMLYDLILCWSLTADEKKNIFHAAKNWIDAFLHLHTTHKLQGYAKRHVTPYIHLMLYHIPVMIERFNGIKQFSGQEVEKINDHAKQTFYCNSNKAQASHNILRKNICMHALCEIQLSDGWQVQRDKQEHRKRKNEYWGNKMKTDARKGHEVRGDPLHPAVSEAMTEESTSGGSCSLPTDNGPDGSWSVSK